MKPVFIDAIGAVQSAPIPTQRQGEMRQGHARVRQGHAQDREGHREVSRQRAVFSHGLDAKRKTAPDW